MASASRLLTTVGLFVKKPYKRDYILQKRPIILRILLIVSTPYVFNTCSFSAIQNVSFVIFHSLRMNMYSFVEDEHALNTCRFSTHPDCIVVQYREVKFDKILYGLFSAKET